jgi:hypothetical protein
VYITGISILRTLVVVEGAAADGAVVAASWAVVDGAAAGDVEAAAAGT